MDNRYKSLLEAQKLIICVDDYGLTPGINQAVLNLAQAGKINATSVLVDGPALTENAIEELVKRKLAGQLEIGLHLNFTELLDAAQDEEVVAPINTHVLKSRFYNQAQRYKIMQELERQFFRFQELFDDYPNYIDGHHHIHMLPGFFEVLREFYQEHRLDHNEIWVRSLNRVHLLNRLEHEGASQVKNWMLRFATKKAKSKVYAFRKELLGVYNFNCEPADYQILLDHWLARAADYIAETGRGAVIMVHPSVPDDQVEESLQGLRPDATKTPYEDSIAKARLVEYQVLLSQ